MELAPTIPSESRLERSSNNEIIKKDMEERKFKTRSEQVEWYAQQRGWEPLTEEDIAALDDAVRMITNLD